MIISKALYNAPEKLNDPKADILAIEWFCANKRIQRLITQSGKEVAIRFFGKGQELKHGDVLIDTPDSLVVVQVLPCETIVVELENLMDLSYVAYQVGNKHLPLFVKGNVLFMPYERPINKWLLENGFQPKLKECVLEDKLNANVDPSHNKRFTFKMNKTIMSIKQSNNE
ncbi:urease accessory protein UreE [Myroides sp. LJL116]